MRRMDGRLQLTNAPDSDAEVRDADPPSPRHCEEPLRRSNPDCPGEGSLDCFAALAMTTWIELSVR
ncbi:hypothetical protein GWG65_32320 [Bradyrhizobium sp. CSA207]|nr:hypothetical protein [Bradyrhizobium sp. CSA207]